MRTLKRAAKIFVLGSLATFHLAGCGAKNVSIDDAARQNGDAPPNESGAAGAAQGSANGAVAPQTRQAFCASSGAGIVLPGTNQCAGDVAKQVFRFAACSCESIGVNGNAKTAAFDSSTGQVVTPGGSIATNGDLIVNGSADIGASVWASQKVGLNADGHVRQDVYVGGEASANGTLHVDGDYFAPSPPNASLVVAGKMHVPTPITAPCDCAPRIDIGNIVKAFAASNDDAASGLAPDVLAAGEDHDLTLDCGRYYFSKITPNGRVTFRLRGRTAVFVDGDITPNGDLSFVFEGGAELDLFVSGNVMLNGSGAFGDPAAPARVRVYAQGTQFGTNGSASFAGNLYAPNAVVGINGDNVVRGAMHAKGFSINGSLHVEYDEAIRQVQGCAPPPANLPPIK